MTAGIKTLEILKRPGQYEQLDKMTKKLINGILEAGKAAGHDVCGGSISGMFGFFFAKGPVKNFQDAMKSDTAKFAKWHRVCPGPRICFRRCCCFYAQVSWAWGMSCLYGFRCLLASSGPANHKRH